MYPLSDGLTPSAPTNSGCCALTPPRPSGLLIDPDPIDPREMIYVYLCPVDPHSNATTVSIVDPSTPCNRSIINFIIILYLYICTYIYYLAHFIKALVYFNLIDFLCKIAYLFIGLRNSTSYATFCWALENPSKILLKLSTSKLRAKYVFLNCFINHFK